MDKSFVHLHNHSEYSILDGLSRVPELVQQALEHGQPAIALTDHGNLYGAIEFYKAAQNAGIKPIIGLEGYLAHNSLLDRGVSERNPFHITILARNRQGYKNLLKLVSIAHTKGFYYKPRFDWDTLSKHADGLTILSGCLSGELQRGWLDGGKETALKIIQKYVDTFGDHFFIELMRHAGVPRLEEINRDLIDIARQHKIQLVATNDSHYIKREDAEIQDILLCVQTNSRIDDKNRMRLDSDSFYVRSSEEMWELWKDVPECLENSLKIADMVEDYDLIAKSPVFPKFPIPDNLSSLEYLKQLCDQGLNEKFPSRPEAVLERLKYELYVIETTGFADYFLVCWDIFKFIRREKIQSAVRGSAAASLVLYLLEVTDVDPLSYNLVFERFLNVERREMPDIDIDIQDNRRAQAIKYCSSKYGSDKVAQIITFMRMGAKAALRDVARVLNLGVKAGDELAKQVPYGPNYSLEKALKETAGLQELVNSNPDYKRAVAIASRLEGTVRHASTHAAGVVITENTLTDYVALQLPSGIHANKDDEEPVLMTQYAMEAVADIGLLKMDFLGLRNLSVLDRTVKLLNHANNTSQNLHSFPLDDPATFKLLSKGDTYGAFQLESDGMRRYITELKPESIGEISAMIALYRPGPMQHIDDFIASKHKRVEISYPHPNLEGILKETYGIIVYQDQILQIAQAVGGYTLGQADILRKAMGKKRQEVMVKERDRFVRGALEKNYNESTAQHIFDLMEPFAGYAFNKAHSVSYALIAYWTAYMRANHPLFYFTALLESFDNDSNRVGECIRNAIRSKLKIRPPDINHSDVSFTIEKGTKRAPFIRFGLANIKNIGVGGARRLVETRAKDGEFSSLEDFCDRVDASVASSTVLTGLVKSGALDCLGDRQELFKRLPELENRIAHRSKMRKSNQNTMIDLFGETTNVPLPKLELDDATQSANSEQILRWESEALGTLVSYDRLKDVLKDGQHMLFADIDKRSEGHLLNLRGTIVQRQQRKTRRGEDFLKCKLQLLDGNVDITIWPDVLKETEDAWTEGNVVNINGFVNKQDGEVSINVKNIIPDNRLAPAGPDTEAVPSDTYNGTKNKGSNGTVEPQLRVNSVTLTLTDINNDIEVRTYMEDVIKKLLNFRGETPVIVEVQTEQRSVSLKMPSKFSVSPSDELSTELKTLANVTDVRVN